MRFFHTIGVFVCLALAAQGQTPAVNDAHAEAKGIPARATPADYEAQAKAGEITIAAEFTGHSLPTAEGPLTSEEFVAVEVALFGPAGGHHRIAADQFTLRVNGKKALPSQPYGMTFPSLRDPEYIEPDAPAKKSKSSMGAGGQGGQGEDPPPGPKPIPLPLQRAMAQRVQKSALHEGERVLPQAGLVFFRLRGKTENLQSVELLYEGPDGKATLKLR
jgi:hypothetical protein